MPQAVELTERPTASRIDMFVGWRQWADAGSVSSGLPHYLMQQTDARQIGTMSPDGFYLFQFPGTHDLVRPVVQFEDGYPDSLTVPTNEFYYSGDDERGYVYFLGDEPHLDVERYVNDILDAAQALGVRRIIGLGGVYGELPYNKERMVSCTYSKPEMKPEFERLAVTLSDYGGGASIGSYICHRAGQRDMEYAGFYAFVPTYDFSTISGLENAIRIENDFMAWLGVMRRVNFMLKMGLDLDDLEQRSAHLVRLMDSKIDELTRVSAESGIREYFERIDESFTEMVFDPLDEVWEEELRRIFDDDEGDDS